MVSLLVITWVLVAEAQSPTCYDSGSDAPSQASVCAMDGSDYRYAEELKNDYRKISTNHCPNHAYLVLNPNFAVNEETTYRVPLYPKYSSEVTLSLTEAGGSIGVLFDGSMLYSAYGGSKYGALDSSYANDYSNSAPYAEGYSFDMCGEHASSNDRASWHAHVPPSCLLHQLNQTETEHSPQIGWAIDGFPVYGPRGPNGIFVKSCDEPTASPDYCADPCGGYRGEIGDGYAYRYYVMGYYNLAPDSCDFDLWSNIDGHQPNCNYEWASEFYPFTPLCLHGCCPSGVNCAYRDLPDCTDFETEAGTTTDFAPVAKDALDIYDVVGCGCDDDAPTRCTNYREGESCTSAPKCAEGLDCASGVCTAVEVSFAPTTLKPNPEPTPRLTSPNKAPPPDAYDSRADDSRADDSRADDSRADDSRADDSRADDSKAYDSKAYDSRAYGTLNNKHDERHDNRVPASRVRVGFFRADRRRRLEETNFVANYTIAADAATAGDVEAAMAAVTPESFDTALQAAAEAADLDLASVTTLAVSEPELVYAAPTTSPSTNQVTNKKGFSSYEVWLVASLLVASGSLAIALACAGHFRPWRGSAKIRTPVYDDTAQWWKGDKGSH
ncbi:hypothetical protein CTAYLR_003458 [Chrysophaeum taylorii]|uniref:YHYH domain-containing protein n=1 Tax=Chrysophaeum taylorii TaxID=2483200 RepID=A0AAD7UA09_9STRA|nr:hypothetical protein CTAYLR_003458 [Chrysophaeum taylorii]